MKPSEEAIIFLAALFVERFHTRIVASKFMANKI